MLPTRKLWPPGTSFFTYCVGASCLSLPKRATESASIRTRRSTDEQSRARPSGLSFTQSDVLDMTTGACRGVLACLLACLDPSLQQALSREFLDLIYRACACCACAVCTAESVRGSRQCITSHRSAVHLQQIRSSHGYAMLCCLSSVCMFCFVAHELPYEVHTYKYICLASQLGMLCSAVQSVTVAVAPPHSEITRSTPPLKTGGP